VWVSGGTPRYPHTHIARTHIRRRFRLPLRLRGGCQPNRVWEWITVRTTPRSVHRRLVSATRLRPQSHHLGIALFRCQVSWTCQRRRRHPVSSPLFRARRTTRCCSRYRFRSCTRCRTMCVGVTMRISHILQRVFQYRTPNLGHRYMLFDYYRPWTPTCLLC